MTKRSLPGSWNLALAVLAVAGAALFAQEARKSVWDGVYTEAQAKRGQQTYQQECSGCHSDDLQGDGISPSIVGSSFFFRWSDLSAGDMFVAIRTTMPPGAPAGLSPQAYADIISYIFKVNQLPAGEEELPGDPAALEKILIEEKASSQ